MPNFMLSRKNKIVLSDYDYKTELSNRNIMTSLSSLDLVLLEEIIYSPLTISLKKLQKNLDLQEKQLKDSLAKFTSIGLLSQNGDTINMDKKIRKWFEFEIIRFNADFTPDLEFLQALLKKIPIQLLHSWYSLPKTTDNLIRSIFDKYLVTPQVLERHIAELCYDNQEIDTIYNAVLNSPEHKISANIIRDILSCDDNEFNELMLFWEYNFVLFSKFEKIGNNWLEMVVPFNPWSLFCQFLKKNSLKPLSLPIKIEKEEDYSYINAIHNILTKAKEGLHKHSIKEGYTETPGDILHKITMLKLAKIEENRVKITESGDNWLKMSFENKAFFLHNNLLTNAPSPTISQNLITEKNIKNIEKSLEGLSVGDWFYFDDFVKRMTVPISDESSLYLKKNNGIWNYYIPEYNVEETELIRFVILKHLSEIGLVNVGKKNNRDCFALTELGKKIFG